MSLPKNTSVSFLPRDPNAYQHRLIATLEQEGFDAGFFEISTRSATLNVLLSPLSLIRSKMRGVSVVHLHWAYAFSSKALSNQWGRYISQGVFWLWLRALRVLGLRLVWTAHNLFPHERVFARDDLARSWLAKSADHIIALNNYTRIEILSRWPVRAVTVIPEGIDVSLSYEVFPKKSRATRNSLRVVIFGHMRRYKGVNEFLKECANAPIPKGQQSPTVIIAGECVDFTLANEINANAEVARASGWRIECQLRHFSEPELSNLLANADLALFAFTSITNSGSVNYALGHGIPVLIPRHPAFDELPDQIALRANQGKLASAVMGISPEKLSEMRPAVRTFASTKKWAAVAAKHAEVYQDVLTR